MTRGWFRVRHKNDKEGARAAIVRVHSMTGKDGKTVKSCINA